MGDMRSENWVNSALFGVYRIEHNWKRHSRPRDWSLWHSANPKAAARFAIFASPMVGGLFMVAFHSLTIRTMHPPAISPLTPHFQRSSGAFATISMPLQLPVCRHRGVNGTWSNLWQIWTPSWQSCNPSDEPARRLKPRADRTRW
jgi:hypothetical protein